MLCCLSFLDLNFESAEYKMTAVAGRKLKIECSETSCVILFLKEIQESNSELRGDISVAQRFFDPRDRYQVSEEDPDVEVEKEVEEYLIDKIYGC